MLSLALMFPFLLATAFSFEANNPPEQGLVAAFLVLYTVVRQISDPPVMTVLRGAQGHFRERALQSILLTIDFV